MPCLSNVSLAQKEIYDGNGNRKIIAAWDIIRKGRYRIMGKGIKDVDKLSERYRVRRLTEADVEMVYALSVGNPMFYQHCPPFVTPKSILSDMKALPPRKDYADKYYIGYFEGDELVAVMDLILGYPNEETAFVGLFMMAKERQRKGIGSGIVEECFAFLGSMGYRFVRLAYAKGNPQSEAFWVKNGFVKTGVEMESEGYVQVVMERRIFAVQEGVKKK